LRWREDGKRNEGKFSEFGRRKRSVKRKREKGRKINQGSA
jgi:hypothetical protein